VPLIELGMSLYKREGRADRGADAASFNEHVVFEPANEPDPGCLLDDDQAQAQTPRRRPGSLDPGRLGLVGRGGPPGCLRHAPELSNSADRQSEAITSLGFSTYDSVQRWTVGIYDAKVTRSTSRTC
jgi:hypothetical protein